MKTVTRNFIMAAVFAALATAGALVYGALSVTPSGQPFGMAPAVAVSGFNVASGNEVEFQTWFDPVVWRGDVAAYKLGTTAAAQTPAKWLASERIKAQNWDTGRRIVTRDAAGTNIPFRFANLSQTQKDALAAGDATKGGKILNFVRGDRSNEQEFKQKAADGTVSVISGSAAGIFRGRASVLGDIIHGKPVYVGAPPANYTSDNYATFKSANSARKPLVYTGANDGMLHAWDAATGDEVFAYVPSMLIPKLKALAEPVYTHTYFVDGAITVGDAYLSSAWKTVLVGGLGAGGKGLYALDVTDATAADENAAKAKILWEISNTTSGFDDLGLTYSEPIIVKLNTGKWAAIVGNGYSDATAQTGSGKAVLYVIDLATGALVRALDTGVGDTNNRNGLSSPSAIDIDGDGDVDYVYAGDLEGNLWKFDLRDKTPAQWTKSALYQAGRPIVGAPDVANHPLGGFMVYFATGAMFTVAQALDETLQNHAYGIWDGAPAANKDLLEQKLEENTVALASGSGARRVRTSTGKSIDWTLHKGWRTELPPGEHVIGTGFVRDGRYHFTSVIAKTETSASGESWLMELDYLNGATDGKIVFNANESTDGKIDESDAVAGETGNERVPVGMYLGSGLWSQPVLVLVGSASTTLFNTNTLAGPGDDQGEPTTQTETGIKGGHFDYDYYNSANGSTDKHEHMYDDLYDATGASFTSASDPAFNLVGDGRVTATTEFFVLVSNGDLSPGVDITVGGQTWPAFKFPNKFDGTQPIYTPATVKKFQFEMSANALESRDWGTGVVRAGLHPTAPECAIYYPNLFGTDKEIHNGALTIWVVKKNTPVSAIVENVKGQPEKGYKVTSDSYVLKKWTVFWHNGKFGVGTSPCYGQAGWVMNPAPDPEADLHTTSRTRDPLSEDPSGLPRLVATGSTSTFVPSATYNPKKNDKSGTITNVITYADGTTVTTTQVLDKKGKVVSSTTKTVTPAVTGGGGGTTPSAAPPAQVASTPIKGWMETRSAGKVGRVAWREVIRD
ncbi:MAG TPA: PilC/PilY family type IV pilus protein [Burkholderiales bacterium]|nr:PilC/PilY family type IV pilus protein [Burkholderiales bacterium]